MTQPNAPNQAQAGPDQGRQTQGDADRPRVTETPARPDQAHMVEDRYIGQRVEHTVRPSGPLPPEQASHAGQLMTGEMDDAPVPQQPKPPLEDVRVTPEEPSVYVAAGEPKD